MATRKRDKEPPRENGSIVLQVLAADQEDYVPPVNNNGEVGGGGPVVARPHGQNRLIPVLVLSPPVGSDGVWGGVGARSSASFLGGGYRFWWLLVRDS